MTATPSLDRGAHPLEVLADQEPRIRPMYARYEALYPEANPTFFCWTLSCLGLEGLQTVLDEASVMPSVLGRVALLRARNAAALAKLWARYTEEDQPTRPMNDVPTED